MMPINGHINLKFVRPVSVFILIGLLAAGGFAASIVWAGQGEKPAPGRTYRVADPANSHPGVLDRGAVEVARTWDKARVLWLGEQFQGLNLTKAQTVEYVLRAEMTGEKEDRLASSLYLIYGECTPLDTGDGPSCVPPLQVIVRTPNAIPQPEAIQRQAGFSTPYRVRGVPAMDLQTATTLWMPDGTTVTVHADPDVRVAAVQALMSANHAALGMGELKSGDDLASLGRPR
jgi:hypothetical protein